MAQTLRLLIAGMVVGAANVIPGVSGGTMAVIFGIYDRFLACTKKGNLKNSLPFLIRVGIGALVGILGFARLISLAYDNFPVATKLFFVGLIVGSVPMIARRALSYCRKNGKCRIPISAFLAFAVSLGLMFGMSLLQKGENALLTFHWWLCPVLFLCGILSAVAMILPGISGSLLMSVIGTYRTIMAAIGGLTVFSAGTGVYLQNLALSLSMLLGCLAGILLGLNGVRILTEKVPSQTYAALLGLVVGSVFTVIPYGCEVNSEFGIGIACLLLSAAVAYLFSKKDA